MSIYHSFIKLSDRETEWQSERVTCPIVEMHTHLKSVSQISEKLCCFRHLTDKLLKNEKFEVSVKCLFYLIYRSDIYRSDGVTPHESLLTTYPLSLKKKYFVKTKTKNVSVCLIFYVSYLLNFQQSWTIRLISLDSSSIECCS